MGDAHEMLRRPLGRSRLQVTPMGLGLAASGQGVAVGLSTTGPAQAGTIGRAVATLF
ncbi:hypothetical protein [Microbispora sp. NBC_01389]|uniref:hypothetical protein n=1 Tax=Microbispora sp. NBC_01389 TaxID=2903584 RepID=UPI00324AB7DE